MTVRRVDLFKEGNFANSIPPTAGHLPVSASTAPKFVAATEAVAFGVLASASGPPRAFGSVQPVFSTNRQDSNPMSSHSHARGYTMTAQGCPRHLPQDLSRSTIKRYKRRSWSVLSRHTVLVCLYGTRTNRPPLQPLYFLYSMPLFLDLPLFRSGETRRVWRA